MGTFWDQLKDQVKGEGDFANGRMKPTRELYGNAPDRPSEPRAENNTRGGSLEPKAELTADDWARLHAESNARLAKSDASPSPGPPPTTPSLRFGRISVSDGRVSTPGGSGPVSGARATVDSGGAIDRRVTATRLILTGPFAFGMRKKKDNRELFILIEGDGIAHVEEVNPNKHKQALLFAAKFNQLAKS